MVWLLLAGAAWGGDILHGYTKATGEATLSDGTPGATARLQLDLGERRDVVSWRGAVDLDVSGLEDGAPGDDALSLRPVELRVGIHKDVYDLTFGKQYVFWGSTDWTNPTDLFTPWDYANMSSELEDYRVAPWAARWTGWKGNSSLDVVWVPFPQPDRIDWSLADTGSLAVEDTVLPKRDLANGSVGARLRGNVAGFDLAAMAFHGLDKRPGMDMRIDLTAMPPEIALVPTHHTMWAFGGDIVRGFGPVLFKGEAAYYLTEDAEGTDPTIRDPEVFTVAGLTYVPTSTLNFTVQGTWNHLVGWDADTEAANWRRWAEDEVGADALAVAEAMGMSIDFPEGGPQDAFGLVERAAYTWQDTVSFSVVGVQSIDEKDHFEMVMVSWSALDGLTVLGGVLLFGGPADSRFGAYEGASRAWGEVKASF